MVELTPIKTHVPGAPIDKLDDHASSHTSSDSQLSAFQVNSEYRFKDLFYGSDDGHPFSQCHVRQSDSVSTYIHPPLLLI